MEFAMGTNYYFMTRNKELVYKYFAVKKSWGIVDREWRVVEEPFIGYKIHLNKLSYGWKPLFQVHEAFRTFSQLQKFYATHSNDLQIFDEYGTEFDWKEYKKQILDHSAQKPEPMKWHYGIGLWPGSGRKRLYHDRCKPEEAEFWTPIDHVEYIKTKHAAEKMYCLGDRWGIVDFYMEYWNDPDYPVDWTEEEFS